MIMNSSTNERGLGGWTREELDETLYQRDNVTSVIEFRYSSSTNRKIALPPAKIDTTEPEAPTFTSAYLNIPISGDDVHIVEFYAPWCPHCQSFAPIYIQIAQEVTKRSIGVNVFFHAVSCTLNSDTCATYDIQGYPTILGYRGKAEASDDEVFSDFIGNTTLRGTQLNLENNLNTNIEVIAATMKFDVSSMERKYTDPESKYSNSADQRNYEQRKVQRGLDVAAEKTAFLEYDATKNDIYHDAILSLAYILQHGIYSQASGKALKNESQKAALHDFLKLVDWATPASWEVRKSFVSGLLENFDTQVSQGKGDLHAFVERNYPPTQKESSNKNDTRDLLPWGFIDAKEMKSYNVVKRRHGLGQDSPLQLRHYQEISPANPKKWTSACNHGPSSSGFTCGLWELFHIISIGSGLTQNQQYGFSKGYILSQHEVVETIRNFIDNFFRCDVCRTNFINMYDNCGHDHCTRLSTDLPMRVRGGHSEVALWLWEVHNAVNVRLLKEKAQQERRNFSKTEELAAKFPTRNSCPSCWLDKDMSQWDSAEVYRFLKGHYWPYEKDAVMNIKEMHGNMAIEGEPLSKSGLVCIMMPFIVIGCLLLRQFITKRINVRKNKYF